MRYLITGGAGYLGSVLSLQLLAEGHSVRVLDDLSAAGKLGALLHSVGAEVMVGQVQDRAATRAALEGIDRVVHLAAVVGAPRCSEDPARAWSVNLDGTQNIVDSLLPGQELIFASTGSVYGRLNTPCSETSDCKPLSVYGQSKLMAEDWVTRAGGICLRFATLMGPSPAMRFDLFVNDFVWRMLHVGRFELYEPLARRSFLDVRDAARAIRLIANAGDALGSNVVNVGSASGNLTKGDVAERISALLTGEVIAATGTPDPDGRDYVVDYTLISGVGYDTIYDFDRSLVDIVALAKLCPTRDWLHLA